MANICMTSYYKLCFISAWNAGGSLLLSGSDDHNLVLSDPFSSRSYILKELDLSCFKINLLTCFPLLFAEQ